MKILLINTVSLGANGISTFIINSAIGLAKNNINVTIRREFGSKVSAACGQLRSEQATESER